MRRWTTVRDEPGGMSGDAGVPLHRQLFLVLHDEIARGALAPGDALPTEQSLCDEFGVSRITVRRALTDLAEQGLIERRQGVGSFVRDSGTAAGAGAAGSFLDYLRQVQFETEVEVREYDVRSPPRAVAEALGAREPLLHVLRLRSERRTGEPLMVTEAWLPRALGDTVTANALKKEALYDLLAAAGVVVDRMDHEMTAELAGPANARLLGVPIGSALIRINRVAYAGGAPHHVMSIALSPKRSRVVMSQTAGEMRDGGGISIAHDVPGAVASD